MKRLALALALAALCAGPALAQEVVEPDETIQLFNGKNLDNWKLFIPDENADVTKTWQVKDGLVCCTGEPAGYMRTKKKYTGYVLRVEWRWPEGGGNNGVLLHIQDKDEVWPKSIEAQLQSGHAGDFWVIGGTDFNEHTDPTNRRVPKQHQSTENKIGEWNEYKIVCEADSIRVYVNGILQNTATGCTVTEGYIGLQSEGTPIEFRKVTVEPVKK